MVFSRCGWRCVCTMVCGTIKDNSKLGAILELKASINTCKKHTGSRYIVSQVDLGWLVGWLVELVGSSVGWLVGLVAPYHTRPTKRPPNHPTTSKRDSLMMIHTLSVRLRGCATPGTFVQRRHGRRPPLPFSLFFQSQFVLVSGTYSSTVYVCLLNCGSAEPTTTPATGVAHQ